MSSWTLSWTLELGSWIASLENVPQAALILELSHFNILTIPRQAGRLWIYDPGTLSGDFQHLLARFFGIFGDLVFPSWTFNWFCSEDVFAFWENTSFPKFTAFALIALPFSAVQVWEFEKNIWFHNKIWFFIHWNYISRRGQILQKKSVTTSNNRFQPLPIFILL